MVYLDNNATTRPSPGVIAAVESALTEFWHNPSSIHRPGQAARHQVELSRQSAADLLGAKPREIVFTSGGTEALDLAIRGIITRPPPSRGSATPTIVSSKVEHAAVRDLLEDLEKRGQARIARAPIDRAGIVDVAALPALLQGAALAVFQWANNETGIIQPVAEIHSACRAAGVPFLCDAVQWVGKEEVAKWPSGRAAEGAKTQSTLPLRHSATSPLPADLLVFSPHKFHGPKGVGILWARQGIGLAPTIHGAQELGRRGGTENVPGILGAGVACREARQWLADPRPRAELAALRDAFETEILTALPDAVVNSAGAPGGRLWNTTNIGFPRLEAEALLLMLSERGVCASAGAACSSGSLDPSPVLLSMGIPPEIAHGSLRFSLSKETTPKELGQAAAITIECVKRLR